MNPTNGMIARSRKATDAYHHLRAWLWYFSAIITCAPGTGICARTELISVRLAAINVPKNMAAPNTNLL